jgi:hypothetical protein
MPEKLQRIGIYRHDVPSEIRVGPKHNLDLPFGSM